MATIARFSNIMEWATMYKKIENKTKSLLRNIYILRSAISYALRSYQKPYSKNICAERKILQSVRYIYHGHDLYKHSFAW